MQACNDAAPPSAEEWRQAKDKYNSAKVAKRSRAFVDTVNLDFDTWRKVMRTLELQRNGILEKDTSPLPRPNALPDFRWDDREKGAQSHRWESCMHIL